MSESETLMKKYPGMDKKLADQIATDTNPKRKADIIAMVEQTFKIVKKEKVVTRLYKYLKRYN